MPTEIKRLQFLDGLNINAPTQSAETIYSDVTVTSSPYTATENETVIYVDTTAGNITINLPSASTASIVEKFYIIKKITNDANKVIVDANGSQTIDGSLTKDIEFYNDCLQVHSDGSNWKIISQNLFSNQVFDVDFVQSNTSLINNLSFTASVASNECTVAIASFDGSALSVANYATVVFHNSSNSSGVQNRRKITSNLSLIIPSGATLGFVSAEETPFYVYGIDTGSGVVLGVSRLQLNDNEVYSSTAISNAADANNVLYSTNAQTSKPIRLLAKVISTQATAGTWASSPTKIQINNGDLEQEKIVDIFESNAGTVYTNANALVYEDKVSTTHGSYNSSTGVYTCNKIGFLTINGITGGTVPSASAGLYVYVRKNSADYKIISENRGMASSGTIYKHFSGKFPCNAGDTFTVNIATDVSFSNLTNAFYNHIAFTLE